MVRNEFLNLKNPVLEVLKKILPCLDQKLCTYQFSVAAIFDLSNMATRGGDQLVSRQKMKGTYQR
jgi:hypothetical protein